jgi:hydroxymethylglutaryl-CoA synthase
MAGVAAYAVKLPALSIAARELQGVAGRLPWRCEAQRVADHDEDAFTLALEAARAALRLHGGSVGHVAVASADQPGFAGLLLDAVGLRGARGSEFRGPLAGLDALLAANDAVAATNLPALVVTADAPAGIVGAAASTAWVLAARGPVQLRQASHAARTDLAGAEAPGPLLADALGGLTGSRLSPDVVQRAALADAQPALATGLGRALPKARVARAGQLVGDAGSTAPFLGLAALLDEAQPGEVCVLAHAAGGRAAAVALELEGRPPARTWGAELACPVEQVDAARLARLRAPPAGRDVSQGAYVSPASYLEGLPARLRFEGQRCARCGRAQFPPRASCLGCGGARLEALALRGQGEVHSVTTIHRGSAPAEFAEQQRRAGSYDVAIVALDEGPRVAAMLAEPAGSLAIGARVEFVVRRLYVQDGAVRYGFKARRPLPASSPGA